MMQPLDRDGWMQSAATAFSRVVVQVSTTLEAWRERRQLENEFAHLRAHGELDRILADSGMSGSDVARLMRAHPSAARQLNEMMSRVGLDRGRLLVTPAIAGELREMEWRCTDCRSWRHCRAWLDSGQPTDGYRAFCLNAEALERLRQHPSTVLKPKTEAASGILTELELGVGQDL